MTSEMAAKDLKVTTSKDVTPESAASARQPKTVVPPIQVPGSAKSYKSQSEAAPLRVNAGSTNVFPEFAERINELQRTVGDLKLEFRHIVREELRSANIAGGSAVLGKFPYVAKDDTRKPEADEDEDDVCKEWAKRNVLVNRAQSIQQHFEKIKREERRKSMRGAPEDLIAFQATLKGMKGELLDLEPEEEFGELLNHVPDEDHHIHRLGSLKKRLSSENESSPSRVSSPLQVSPRMSRQASRELRRVVQPEIVDELPEVFRHGGVRDVGYSALDDPYLQARQGILGNLQGNPQEEERRCSKVSSKISSDYTDFKAEGSCDALMQQIAGQMEIGVCFLVVLNAVTIGIETDYRTRAAEIPKMFDICEDVFCCLYVIELVFRLYMQRCNFFCNGWNLFDFVIVGLQLFELGEAALCEAGNGMMDVSFLRSFRIIRIIRITRMMGSHFPELQFIEELRTLIFSIIGSLTSFCWALVLLCFLVYSMSVCFTQMVSAHVGRFPTTPHLKELEYYYGSLGRTFLTLLESIAGGLSWDEAVAPLLSDVGVMPSLLYMAYVAFCAFAMLNVVTGVFVENASQRTQEDKEEFLENHLSKVFRSADEDGSGVVDWEEFQERLETKEMKDYFKALDVDLSEARGIFQLLDADRSGSIDGVEFVSGCMRLQGNAKALELRLLMNLTSRLHEWTIEHVGKVEKEITWITKVFRQHMMDGGPSFEESVGEMLERNMTRRRTRDRKRSPLGTPPSLRSPSQSPRRLEPAKRIIGRKPTVDGRYSPKRDRNDVSRQVSAD